MPYHIFLMNEKNLPPLYFYKMLTINIVKLKNWRENEG